MKPSMRSVLSCVDVIAVSASTLTLACLAFVIAAREYTLTGQIMALAALLGIAATALTVTRFHLVAGLTCLALIVTIDRIDEVKFAATLTRLHPSDAFIAANFLRDLDGSVVVQYGDALRPLLSGLAVLAAALPALWLWERRAIRTLRRWRLPAGSLAAALLATTLSFAALAHSDYLRALSSFPDAHLQWVHRGLRVSAGVLQTLRLNAMDNEIRQLVADARRAGLPAAPDAAAPADCGAGGCPDIVFVHLESVFDPVLLAAYRDRGYLDHMDALGTPSSESGLLRVHTWGGASWVSEFAVLCGVDPQLFGQAGILPHVTLSPYVGHCLPDYLKRLGYETHAIYTAAWNFAGAGPGFRRYGIDNFIDVRKIELPAGWHAQQDRHFVAQARRILAQPRTRPRFIWIATNWNHGPHGHPTPHGTFAGPFDIARADDPATRDYINRLNDTFTEMARLERDLAQPGSRVALLFYGDHHPGFAKRYAQGPAPDAQAKPDSLTLYRFAKGYAAAPQAPRRTLWIEELPGRFLAFAGVPLSPAMLTIGALRAQCGGADATCPAPVRSAIGAAILAR